MRLPRSTSRRKLLERLRELGWSAPYRPRGADHDWVKKTEADGSVRRLKIPNEHKGDIGVKLLGELLTQAGIGREEWLGRRA